MGWKSLQIKIFLNQNPLYNHVTLRLNPLTDVDFKTADGSLLSWKNQDNDRVLHHSVSSPLILHIRGLTINVRISEYGSISKSEDQSQLLETLQPGYSSQTLGCAWRYVRNIYKISGDDDNAIQFAFLIFGTVELFISQNMHFLLLLYQPEGSHYFERINSLSADSFRKRIAITHSDPQGWTFREVAIK